MRGFDHDIFERGSCGCEYVSRCAIGMAARNGCELGMETMEELEKMRMENCRLEELGLEKS